MLQLPVEIVLEVLKNLSKRDIVSLSRTNKYLNNICLHDIYSNVVIREKYCKLRFPITHKFLRTMSSSVHLSRRVRILVIEWSYPRKVDQGFDSMVPLLRGSLLNMRYLESVSLRIRLRDKSFNRCFPQHCMFHLQKLECNFGRREDKERLLGRYHSTTSDSEVVSF
jgi:hypothetical protein